MAHTRGEADGHEKSCKTENAESGKKDPKKREEHQPAAYSPILGDELDDVIVRVAIHPAALPSLFLVIIAIINLWVITLIHGEYIAERTPTPPQR